MKGFRGILVVITIGAGVSCAQTDMKSSGQGMLSATKATFAGGCFWCMEKSFEEIPGVIEVISGYTGGQLKDPDYEDVSSGVSGHYESVQVTYDPAQVRYEEILETFWREIDPTDDGGQFADRGSQYKTVIFYHDEKQKELAEASRRAMGASKRFSKPIVTEILKAAVFYKAEDYHQDYYKKQPEEYRRYRFYSGRAPYLKKVWGDGDGR